uniref:Uncharacterized protein n=1 Tax=uncultured bacterium Ad_136_J17_contig1 TaxID=1489301 RepID=A0A0B4N147_9BACT|nr:putative hypothetical protein [uncultured bacterium Ad_136_J17_contig1]
MSLYNKQMKRKLFSIILTGLLLGEGMAFAQTDPFPAVNFRAYMGNMVVVAKVMENGSELTGVVLAAYDADGVIRGKARLTGSKTIATMMVYGDTSGDEIHFAVSTDAGIRHLPQDKFSYLYNGLMGSKKSPHVVVLNGFALAEKSDNTEVLETWDGQTSNVTLGGRTLYKDGMWNTLCLPFDVTLAGSVLDGAEAHALSSASVEGATLKLNFTDVLTKLEAGVPYLIKWAKPDDYDADPSAYDLVEPTFENVSVKNVSVPFDNGESGDGHVQFIGTYNPIDFNVETPNVLVLGMTGSLFYPDGQAATQLRSCRAYFKVGSESSAARVLRTEMYFGDATAVRQPLMDNEEWNTPDEPSVWYDLCGRPLPSQPLTPGIYIWKGKKIIVNP